MPSHIKTYDGSEDPDDHLKIFQTTAKTERWAMPTWCHMFNSTLTGNARVWFDDLLSESIDSYDNLKKAFLENYLQQKKCIKDPIELHNIKQRDGESTEDFVRRYKLESRDVKGAPKCMRIFGFVHGITNPELIKRLHDKIPKTVDEMMRVATSFLRGEVAASNHEQKKSFPPWKQQEGEDEGTEGLMIIEAEIGGHCIHRMYVDGDSASEILYEHCFSRLRREIKNQLTPATTLLIGFSSEIVWPIGQIQLLVRIRDEEHSTLTLMNFVVIRSPSPYNGIIGRPGVRKQQAVPPTAHGMLKILVEGGVITLKSSRMVPLECAMVFGPEGNPPATKQAVEERFKVAINPEYPEQTKPADMTGVPRYVAEHRLKMSKGCSPVRQKKRGQAADQNQAIQEEVGKLMEAGIMKEVHYHDWLSNPVMVKKHDDSWRMCVDFKDLNKACPKDGYLLPEIDWKVECLCGFPIKCFLDAYKGYHQIQMAKEDKENIVFITSQGIFCYTKMPFGLRNARATYQRLVDKAFHKQIGRNLEVYVDDLVIKSRMKDEIVRDIEETFKTLREINMKLNPKKCTFGVEEGMFLGYKVNTKGLKVCLDKKSDFHWTTEAEEAFKQMKWLIAELPMLTAPMEKEELIVYLAVTKETVSAILMTKREAKQMPIYFVSRALRGPEINYTSVEKLVLALVHASKCLKDTLIEVKEELSELWILFTYGSSCIDGSRAGLILINPEGMEFTYALRFRFDATNNKPEYEALIARLGIAKQIGVKNLLANVDSRLVANQVNGTYVAKEADMIRYLEKVKTLTSSFKAFSIKQVRRRENKKADALSKIASTSCAHLSKQVLVEELKEKSISESEILAVVKEEGGT
ncbi:reverse transcriptase domain-containing protein [Tanacetum coccineum]